MLPSMLCSSMRFFSHFRSVDVFIFYIRCHFVAKKKQNFHRTAIVADGVCVCFFFWGKITIDNSLRSDKDGMHIRRLVDFI